jgi:hypothetical protein
MVIVMHQQIEERQQIDANYGLLSVNSLLKISGQFTVLD